MFFALFYGGLYLEAAAIASVAIQRSVTVKQFEDVTPVIRRCHWIVIGVYLIVGIGGFRILGECLWSHRRFVDWYSGHNAAGLTPNLMLPAAATFAFIEPIFLLSVSRLGRCKRWARYVFSVLVLPISFFYPLVMLTAFQKGHDLNSFDLFEIAVICGVFAFGLFSLWFYNCRAVTQQLRWS